MIRLDALALLALAIAVCAFFAPAIFGDRAVVPWNMDLWHPWAVHASPEDLDRPTRVADSARQFMVMRKLATEALQDGRAPLWNPWIYCGTPFLANYQPGVFYPPNVILSFSGWSIPDQMSAYLVFHFLSAVAGMFLLLRACRLSAGAALLGAVAFGWGGHLGSRTGNQTMMATAAWLPWVFWASRRWFDRGDRTGWVAMAAFLGLSGLAGFAQTYVLTVYLWIAFGLVAGLSHPERTTVRLWGGWASAGACGLLLASVHLVPTLEFVGLAQDARNTLEMLISGTLHPWTLGKIVVPDLLGHPVDHNSATHLLRVGSGYYHQTERSTAVYMGILPLLLASVVLLSPGDHRRTAAAAIFLTLGGLILCFDNPLLRIILHLPGMGFSRPDRATLLWSTGLSMLAALGAERMAGGEGPGRARGSNQLPLALGVLAALFAGGVAVLGERILPEGVFDEVGAEPLLRASLRAMAMAGLAILIFALRAFGRLSRPAFLLAATGVVALDVGWYAHRMNILQPEESLFRPGAAGASLEYLRARRSEEGRFRIFRFEPRRSQFSGALPPSTAAWYDLEDALGFDSINLARYEELMTALDPGLMVKRANFRGTRRAEIFPSPLLDLMNVRYILAGDDRPLPGIGRVHVSDLAVHENPNCLPRAFLVPEVRVIEDPRRLLEAMARASFRPDLWAYSEVPIQGLGGEPAGESGGSCRVVDYRDAEVRVAVEPQEAALLLLADAYYPGWKASVDGIERPIHRVDHLFRGVVVEPGDREVTFCYEPRSFRIGAGLSLGALGVLLVALLRTRRRIVSG